MGCSSLPPGFRFHPTDEELVGYYLKRKVEGLHIELEVIPVIDLYKFDPWELPAKSFLPKGDMEWFFFCPRDRKYPNGSRTNRATRSGYWKATGKDRKVVVSHSSTIGYRKTLVFYCGRAPGGDRTDWVMHEYRLSDDVTQESQNSKINVALCRIIKKNEHALKNGDTKFKQVGSCSSRNEDFISSLIPTEPLIVPNDMPFEANYMGRVSSYSSPIASPYHTTPTMEIESIPMETNPSSHWVLPDFIFDSSQETPQGREVSGYFPPNEFSANSMAPCNPYDQFEFSPITSFSNFAENVEHSDDFSQFGSMPHSPYSGHGDYTHLLDNGSMPHEGPESWNQAPICRQSSGEGSFGEYNGLWSQEDSYIVVI